MERIVLLGSQGEGEIAVSWGGRDHFLPEHDVN